MPSLIAELHKKRVRLIPGPGSARISGTTGHEPLTEPTEGVVMQFLYGPPPITEAGVLRRDDGASFVFDLDDIRVGHIEVEYLT